MCKSQAQTSATVQLETGTMVFGSSPRGVGVASRSRLVAIELEGDGLLTIDAEAEEEEEKESSWRRDSS